MNLESERLNLIEVTWNDVDDIHKLHSYEEVDEFNTLGLPKDIDETREVIRPMMEDRDVDIRKLYFWKIITKQDNEFVGIAGMNLSVNKFKLGEIYYKFMPGHWGKGYATESAKTLIQFGFRHLKLHRIEAGVATENIKSIRVLEKIGMTQEGIRRKILPIRGEWKDNFHYAIVENDPFPSEVKNAF